VNRNFTQTITVRCKDRDALLALARGWDALQAGGEITGYAGTRILEDLHEPDVYVIEADFGVVDPLVSARAEAERNNDRPETQEWDRRLRAMSEGDPVYHHFDEIYRTGI
jgi:hypothetical protein